MKYFLKAIRFIFNPFGVILFNSGDEELYSKRKWFISFLVFLIAVVISAIIVYCFHKYMIEGI